MAYEATAQLYQRQADLAKKRARAEAALTIGDLATQYRQANRDLEANLESRGILRSGEGMRGRVRLGAAEKAAQLAAETTLQGALDQADLTHLQQLAELQAKGYNGGAPGTATPKPETPGTPSPVTPPRETGNGSDSAGGTDILGYPKEVWDNINWDALGSGTTTGMPSITWDERVKITPSGMGSGQNPNTWSPGQYVSGPDRKLSNGGAVVDGIYIPPGIDWGALAPKPVKITIPGITL